MAVITPLSVEDIESVIAHYPLPALEDFWPAGNGIENTNYFLSLHKEGRESTSGKEPDYVLTVIEDKEAHTEDILPLLHIASEQGLPVADPVVSTQGTQLIDWHERKVLISPCLPGSHPTRATSAQLQGIGRFLGRLHRCSDVSRHSQPESIGTSPPVVENRSLPWLTQSFAEVRGTQCWNDQNALEASLRTIASLTARHDVSALPAGMIHGDLFRDNCLFEGDSLTGVLDFHHAGAGVLCYDLAVVLNDWCSDEHGGLEAQRAHTLIKAYDQERPLHREEIWFLPMFTLFAATRFWLSRLLGVHRGAAATKDPTEMRARTLFHLHAPWQVDSSALTRVNSV